MKFLILLAIIVLPCVSASAGEYDTQYRNCLQDTNLAPMIKVNRCSFSVVSYRCRSGADLSACIGVNKSDVSTVFFQPGKAVTNIHLQNNGEERSETFVCSGKAEAVNEDGNIYCKTR